MVYFFIIIGERMQATCTGRSRNEDADEEWKGFSVCRRECNTGIGIPRVQGGS